MIRINLLAGERQSATPQGVAPVAFESGQRDHASACSAHPRRWRPVGVGWRYWSLRNGSRRSSTDEITAAQQETARLRIDDRAGAAVRAAQAQLQQRVALIEQLRKGQSGPVHMLDQISRALPANALAHRAEADGRPT